MTFIPKWQRFLTYLTDNEELGGVLFQEIRQGKEDSCSLLLIWVMLKNTYRPEKMQSNIFFLRKEKLSSEH